MSRLLSLRNASRIKARQSHSYSNPLTTTTCQQNASSRLLNNGSNSHIATAGKSNRHANRFHSSNPNNNGNHANYNRFHNNNNNSESHLTVAQLQLNLTHKMQGQIHAHAQAEQGKGAPLLSELTAWVLQKVKVPKGFENFFPKNKGPKPKSSSGKTSSSKTTKSKEESPFQHLKDKNKKKAGGSSGGGGKKEEENQMISAAALLLLVLAGRSLLDDDSAGNGREITWSDFYNHILEPGDVDRIVVINGKTARVFLEHGSPGVPFGRQTSDGSISSKKRRDSKDLFGDDTVMDMTTTASPDNSNESSSSTGSRSAAQSNRQLVYHFHIGSVESFEEKMSKSQEGLGISPRDFVPVQYANETNWPAEAMKAAPAILMIGALAYMARGMGGMGAGGGAGGPGGIFKVGKSNAKKVKSEDVSVTFADVAGCQEAKKEIMEFVDFLKDSSRFTKLGAKIPKGALLCGPPGTGKTLLAKAVAGEAGVPFFSISGSDFIEMFVGVGPSRVRDLFKEARAEAPCIIFIDEIDAVGRKRGRGNMAGGNDERENTLNQLLVEMDGFSPSTGVVVLAGTNRADILDEALLRPGRFDRQVQVDKPDVKGRQEIFMVHLQGIKLDGEPREFAGRLAGLTPGFSGADIANICNEGAIVAARRNAESVTVDDFEKATDRIVGGLESNKIMSKEERSIVAHHEAGHAIAGWFLEHADPLLKVTIIPRTSGALGYAQYLPKEVFLRTEEQIMHIVMMALAGRAAEEVFFGKVTTGASDDLRRVTELVYSTIQVYGMNSRVGQLAFPKDPNAMPGDKPYSDSTAEAMDEEAKRIVDEAYANTLKLVKEKKDDIEKVANLLLDKETITHDDIIDLVGRRPFSGNEAYDEFVSKRFEEKKMDEEKKAAKLAEDEKESDDTEVPGGLNPVLAFKV